MPCNAEKDPNGDIHLRKLCNLCHKRVAAILKSRFKLAVEARGTNLESLEGRVKPKELCSWH